MYQSQQYHTSNYRGNQQGHDAYLRADSQSPSHFGTQNVTSQYRGFQRPFQPTGPVTSMYGQNQAQTSASFGTGAQNYHTSSYRGDQQGHDSYLRSDSRQPSQFGGGQSGGFNSSLNNLNTGFTGTGMSSFSQNQNQFVSPDSYHTANYHGNQQGHDSYLRSDSQQPAQHQLGISSAGTGYGHVSTSNFSSMNNNIGASVFGGTSIGGSYGGSMLPSSLGSSTISNTSSFGTSGLGAGAATFGSSNLGTFGGTNWSSGTSNQNQFVSPESYHTSNYRGNQQGHDNYLRSDSQQPAQSSFGTTMGSGNFGVSYSTSTR